MSSIDIFNKAAVFSDETRQFVQPNDPNPGDAVAFNIRVAKGSGCTVTLHIATEAGAEKPKLFTSLGNEWAKVPTLPSEAAPGINQRADQKPRLALAGSSHPMTMTRQDELFDYYSVSLLVWNVPIRYYYSIYTEEQTFYYNKQGLRPGADGHFNFRLVPGLRVPEWAKGAVMYQIFVDRFYNGDPTNDVVRHEYTYLGKTAHTYEEWGQDMANDDYLNNFYGGDIQGIMDKIPYLKDLGVEVIYLNPVFVSPSSHKYDAQDYDYIDPHYGKIVKDEGEVLKFERIHNRYATRYLTRTTDRANLEASNTLFAEFIEEAHKNGIKVILDGVFNHCGSFNKWLDVAGFYKAAGEPEGAYHSKDSPYHSFFLWHGGEWPENNNYDGWWANPNHPKLNFETSPELFDYILEIGKKWVSPPFNADGWRLDVAADLGQSREMNHKFWKAFREAVREANPDAIVLAENYGDPSSWLNNGEWDTVMNYDAFMEPLTWFLTGVNKHSEESRPYMRGDTMAFEGAMRYHMSHMNVHALQTAMNQLSNHDHSRFLTRTNFSTGRLHNVGPRAAERGINKNIMMEAVVFQMTWPGAPTIYYGDEAGLAGWTDPDNRRPFPWGKEDIILTGLHKALIAMRRRYPVLREGSLEFLWLQQGFLSYGRWNDQQKVVVTINSNTRPMDVTLPIWKVGLSSGTIAEMIITGSDSFQEPSRAHSITNGELALTVPPHASIVLAGG